MKNPISAMGRMLRLGWRAFAVPALCLAIILAPAEPVRGASVVISTNFPGGNVLVRENGEGVVLVSPDLRGGDPWFYWSFEATADQAGWVSFSFPDSVVGLQGPAVSVDAGTTWDWMGAVNEKVWNGAGADDHWSTADNWGGVALVDNADGLVFGGSARLANTNDLPAGWRFSNLVFTATAGPFVLNGNPIRAMAATMGFANLGSQTQTLNLNVNASSQASLWNAYGGDLVMNGAVTGSAASSIYAESTLTKDGLGTLTLGGSNLFTATTPGLKILNGKVVLDMNTGGSFTTNTVLQFGLKNASGGDINQQGGTLVVRGKQAGPSSQAFASLTLFDATSIAKIQVDPNGGSGTVLTLGNTWTRTGNSFLNIDLSRSGAALASAPALTASGLVGSWCTVTDPSKTGFSTTNSAGQIVRNATLYEWIGAGSSATNYWTSGARSLSALTRFGTLTIQGGGALTGIYNVNGGAVLMEEGVADYTNACAVFGSAAATTYLHQFSTNGDLVLNCGLSGTFSKTGPGKVVFRKATATSVTLNAMEGPIDLQAALTGDKTIVNVFQGGSLSGGGTVGSGNMMTNVVTVFPGGTLDGTRRATHALTINGRLTLKDRSTVSVVLTNSAFSPLRVTGVVTNLGANLALTLGYPPGEKDEITLLASDIAIDGAFSRVNGAVLSAGNTFTLTHQAQEYPFILSGSSTNVIARRVSGSRPGVLMMIR